MAEYGKLLSRIWADPEFVSLTARAQQIYCLLLSHPSRNLAGILPLTLKRWAASTVDATVDNISDALKALTANKFIVVDWDLEEVLIRTYIRNDEVYRQPNLMTAARRFATQVTSPALRWALFDELIRLPDHKDSEKTLSIANSLVEGLIRPGHKPFEEPLAEPFQEPMPEGPGVGGYLSAVGEHPHPHPSPAPTPAALAIAEPLDAVSATPGADLVQKIVPREFPDSERAMLRIKASELINRGTPHDVVAEALHAWVAKPGIGPGILPSLVSDVIKRRSGRAHAPPNGIGKPSLKALGYQALGDEIIAEMEQS